jgi:hypothetical protein
MSRVLRHNVVPLRQAWCMDDGNDLTQAEQRPSPGGETELKRSWVTVAEAAAPRSSYR